MLFHDLHGNMWSLADFFRFITLSSWWYIRKPWIALGLNDKALCLQKKKKTHKQAETAPNGVLILLVACLDLLSTCIHPNRALPTNEYSSIYHLQDYFEVVGELFL